MLIILTRRHPYDSDPEAARVVQVTGMSRVAIYRNLSAKQSLSRYAWLRRMSADVRTTSLASVLER